MKRIITVGGTIGVAFLSAAGIEGQEARPPLRGEVRAEHGVVAAGRSFAANAGARVMSAGGNAIDAGAASVLAAAVVEISHFGLGGEAPIIIYSARDREVVVINGQGSAPMAAGPERFAGLPAPPGNGPLGATIPAVVDSVALALSKYGTKSFEEVVQPAIDLADGFPMYEFLRRYHESERRASEQYEWTRRTYYADGRVGDLPAAESRAHAARPRGGRAAGARVRRVARGGHPRGARRVL
jgi:gamma-glutamyltranspeptidase/glutathione hydrolase